MKKIAIGILIVLLYCFPFVYFSMYLDFASGSMLGYLFMIAITSLLAFFGKIFSNSTSLIIGNILSVIISFYFIGEMMGNERWGFYFKPLTPYQLLTWVSFLNLIPQFFALRLAVRHKKRNK